MPIKNLLKKLITKRNIERLKFFQSFFYDNNYTKSYSQEGEDILLKRIFKNKINGFYVDVGAHHPRRYSNTYLFYKMGWRGINIDATPKSMDLFKKIRPRDINLELGISEYNSEIDFYSFNDSAINTFSAEIALSRSAESKFYIKDKIKVPVTTLKYILDKHHFQKEIDFLTIDVEGFDLHVLKSNDWSRYKPRYVLVELLNFSLSELCNNEVCDFLESKNYQLVYKTYYTCFFKKND